MDKSLWAENLLKDEWFQQMMSELKAAEINKFAMSQYDDISSREQAYMTLRTLEIVETYLEGLSAQKKIDAKKLKIL
jgi:hypothetical protein